MTGDVSLDNANRLYLTPRAVCTRGVMEEKLSPCPTQHPGDHVCHHGDTHQQGSLQGEGKMMARKLIPIGMASLMFLGPALARAGSERLSLKRAIEVALDKSPLLQAARHEVEAVEAGVGQARAGFLPKLDISESFTRADNPVFAFSSKLDEGRFTQADFEVDRLNRPGPENNFRTNLSLAQPIYTAGRASIGLQRARLSRDASARGFIRERQRVLFQVAKAYYGVLLAQENLEVIQSALRAAQANVELARLVSRPGLWSNLTSCPRRSAWRVSANRKSPQQIR